MEDDKKQLEFDAAGRVGVGMGRGTRFPATITLNFLMFLLNIYIDSLLKTKHFKNYVLTFPSLKIINLHFTRLVATFCGNEILNFHCRP